MNAAQDAYDRLMAARRKPSEYEIEERKKDSEREQLQARIRRRLPKVY